MRSSRFTLLFTCLVAILVAAVLGQAVAQEAEAVFKICAGEHQEGGQDDGSHCPCVCHHHQAGVAEWQVMAPIQLAVVSMVIEQPSSVVEAPRASIEYPPQLA